MNVWTGGRVCRAGNPMVALDAAYEGRDGVTRSLWRSLVEEDAPTAMVDRLRRIAAEDGVRGIGGSHPASMQDQRGLSRATDRPAVAWESLPLGSS